MANMTATTMATYLPEVWSRTATVTYRAKTIFRDLMDRRWEPQLGVGMGDTVNIPAFSQNSGASTRSTFGTAAALTFTANTESQVQLVVNRMAYYGYARPYEMGVQAMPEYERLLQEGIGQALALEMDANLAADNSNGLDAFSTVVGTDNVDVTDDDLITMMTNMNNQNAPLEGRYLAVSPATYASMLKIDRIVNQLTTGALGKLDANKGQGLIGGPVYTFQVYMSNNLEAGTSGKKNAGWQKEAIALCVQKDTKIIRETELGDGTEVGAIDYVAGFLVYGHKMVKSGFGNELDSK